MLIIYNTIIINNKKNQFTNKIYTIIPKFGVGKIMLILMLTKVGFI